MAMRSGSKNFNYFPQSRICI